MAFLKPVTFVTLWLYAVLIATATAASVTSLLAVGFSGWAATAILLVGMVQIILLDEAPVS